MVGAIVLKKKFMQIIIECLPILLGIAIACFARVLNRIIVKLFCMIVLPLVSGITANMLSKEGSGLVWADVLMSYTGCLMFTALQKYVVSSIANK